MKHTMFTPYRVCPLGAHVDHQLGQVTGFAIDRGVNLEFDITEEVTFDNSRELARNSYGNCENNTGKRRMRSVWNMATTASGGVTHYAKFPNELAERCILCGTAEGDVVLDPFVGSGTSCRVANRYGRQYIGD